ncbi:hypothetical protein [uncultured Alsobacter sp.]|uniref:hypothetical protein n=1 Tax=uncultured Alsobacter sp. TaxID=1748258 RepID=UPI0025DBA2D1|nr:hypothetical protein [uncultured Alsobacter sp.]
MSARRAPPPGLLGQRVDGLNGLRLAAFSRYHELLDVLRPLEAASHSAFLDDDIRLFRRYQRDYAERLRFGQAWMERACRVLCIESLEAVIEALREEAEIDAIWQDVLDMLRPAWRKADAATTGTATARDDAPGPGKTFSQNEIGTPAPHGPTSVTAPDGPARDSSAPSPATRKPAVETERQALPEPADVAVPPPNEGGPSEKSVPAPARGSSSPADRRLTQKKFCRTKSVGRADHGSAAPAPGASPSSCRPSSSWDVRSGPMNLTNEI